MSGSRAATGSSIRDVARAAGVSTATVSRALRGLDRVSEATRAKVLRVADDLQYVASPTAATLASGRTGVVGVVVPFLQRWFFATLLAGTEEVLRKNGYHILLFSVGMRSSSRTLMLDQRLLAKRVGALLVLSADLEPPEVELLTTLRVPVVTVGVDLPAWDRVGIDDGAAVRLALDHLLGLGHRRIAYVGGTPAEDVHVATAMLRRAGLVAGLGRAGLRLAPELDLQSDWTLRGGLAAGRALLALPEPPTAIVAASDEMAVGVLLAARSAGVDVPGQLSVVGLDDHDMAFSHELTTVAQPVREQGALASTLLLEALDAGRGAARRPRRTEILPTTLVVRHSTGPPPVPPRPAERRSSGSSSSGVGAEDLLHPRRPVGRGEPVRPPRL